MIFGIIKFAGTLAFLVIVCIGVYYMYKWWAAARALDYCKDNYPDRELRVSENDGPVLAKNECTSLAMCDDQANTYEDTLDNIELEDADANKVNVECMKLCTAWNSLVQCRCDNCPTCNDDCGMDPIERCRKYVTCGTTEYQVFN